MRAKAGGFTQINGWTAAGGHPTPHPTPAVTGGRGQPAAVRHPSAMPMTGDRLEDGDAAFQAEEWLMPDTAAPLPIGPGLRGDLWRRRRPQPVVPTTDVEIEH